MSLKNDLDKLLSRIRKNRVRLKENAVAYEKNAADEARHNEIRKDAQEKAFREEQEKKAYREAAAGIDGPAEDQDTEEFPASPGRLKSRKRSSS